MAGREGPYRRDHNSTNYLHPNEENLFNLHKAMEYNALGQPVLRTTLGGADAAQRDAFGRLRVGNPFTLFDTFHRYQDNGKASSYTAGSGTVTHDPNSSSLLCAVGTASGDKVLRETSRVFAYQPGKSLQIFTTFCMALGKTNLRQRIGYFSVDDGIFLEQNGTSLRIVRRSKSSGSVVDTVVEQADWNVDPLNGAGSSTRVLDITKAQILFIDIEWLGVGSVRVGFVIDGRFICVHQFNHANSVTTTYMGTACLPLRLEVENIGATASASTYRQICSTVISEGGYELQGRPRSVGHAITSPYTLSAAGTLYPVVSLRLKSSRLNGIVLPKNYSLGATGNANYRYTLVSGGTTTGGTWVDGGSTDSSVEYNLTATSITGGNSLEAGYIINSNQSASTLNSIETPFKYQLERNIFTSTPYEFTLCVACSGANNTVFGSINWEELT